MKKRCIKATQMIFAYGMTLLLIACFMIAIIYIVAIIIGQPMSIAIHAVISKKVLPIIYYLGILLSADGLLYLYIKGELLFRLDIPTKPLKDQNHNK